MRLEEKERRDRYWATFNAVLTAAIQVYEGHSKLYKDRLYAFINSSCIPLAHYVAQKVHGPLLGE